jgi:nitrite reductase/ring-hydroxylating ferredoxin subunit
MKRHVLCRLEALPDPGSLGLTIETAAGPLRLMLVRNGRRVVAYRNECPHIGAPLDWVPGRFLDIEKRHILCANHGALFRIEDGHCVAGPCGGRRLSPLSVHVDDGDVIIEA